MPEAAAGGSTGTTSATRAENTAITRTTVARTPEAVPGGGDLDRIPRDMAALERGAAAAAAAAAGVTADPEAGRRVLTRRDTAGGHHPGTSGPAEVGRQRISTAEAYLQKGQITITTNQTTGF